MQRRILTDIDNTVFNFSPHFETWVENAGYPIRKGVLGTTYRFEDMFHDEEHIYEALDKFYECEHTMTSFQPLPNTVEPIRRLHDAGFRFTAITACTPKPGMAERRWKNLQQVFGIEFDDVLVTGLDLPKTEALKQFEPTYWVEDHLGHALGGASIGHTVFLIDHPYNKGEGPFIRVPDWLAIEQHIMTA